MCIVIAGIYYIWDWTVLLLYAIKIIQIKNAKKGTSIESATNKYVYNTVMKRVYIGLHKILLLTIIYEILTVSMVVMFTLFDDTTYEGAINSAAFIFMDPFVSSCIMYLMIERNNDEYIRALSLLYKSKIFCWLNCLMRDTLEYTISNEIENDNATTPQSNRDNENIENIGNMDEKKLTNYDSIEIHHKQYIDMSVPTETAGNKL